MNISPPIFIPPHHRAEVAQMSKIELMDMCWQLCVATCGSRDPINEFRVWRNDIKRMRQEVVAT